MINAAIIAVGSEIMRGKMDDTNSTFFSRWFEKKGIRVKYRLNVDDTIESIKEGISFCSDCDIILSTGGLGPTDDDLTREGFAAFLDIPLEFNEDSWGEIKSYFKGSNYRLADSNKRQAYTFKNGGYISNKKGTASGLYYFNNKSLFVLLPGPPVENSSMTEDVSRLLTNHGFISSHIKSKVFRLYGTSESVVADLFAIIEKKYFDEVGYYFSSDGYIELHFRKFYDDSELDIQKFNANIFEYLKILDTANICYTEDVSIQELIIEMLNNRNATIGFAESCTGGAISASLVKTPGASTVYHGSIISYSNEIKQKILGVSENTLNSFGAVSSETVKEMSINSSKILGVDIVVAVSGIAGPVGGTDEKPVGLVWFSFKFFDKIITESVIFSGDRERVIARTVSYVFIKIYTLLLRG